jgi:hypothetical protein
MPVRPIIVNLESRHGELPIGLLIDAFYELDGGDPGSLSRGKRPEDPTNSRVKRGVGICAIVQRAGEDYWGGSSCHGVPFLGTMGEVLFFII